MIFLLFAGAGLLFGFGAGQIQHFEHRAAEDIRAKLQGEHRRVSVHTVSVGLNALAGHFKRVTISAADFSTPGLPLFTEPKRPQTGRIDDLRIELTNFDLRNLHVKRLSSAISNCRYDLGLALSKQKIRLTKSGVGRGKVEIDEHDLESFILKKFQDIKSVQVRIADGRITVAGHGEFLAISTNFKVEADLAPINGNTIVLTNAAISFDGKPADELSRRALLGVLNPVVDFNRDLALYDAILVDKIMLADGIIRVEGTTQIPNEPQSKVSSRRPITNRGAFLWLKL